MAVNNDNSLELNNQVFNVLPGDEVVYEEMDKIRWSTYIPWRVFKLTPMGMSPHKLRLKNWMYHYVIKKQQD